MPTPPDVYRLAPLVVARLVGLAFVVLAVLLFATTALVGIAGLSPDLLVVVAVVLLAAVLGLAWWLRSAAEVLRCTPDGYRVRLVRGAGVTRARWADVDSAVATTRRGAPCLELRLRDGQSTTIPVGILAVDREQFVREVRQRLSGGRGPRPD